MHRIRSSIAASACLCLLVMQISGLHLHVDPKGNDAGIHGTHVHQADPDDHDHSADIDVPLLEQLGISWSKLIPLLLACVFVFLAAVWVQLSLRAPPIQTGRVRQRLRWRPPLRAPPISP